MPVENRSLTPGTILVARYRKAEHRCTVEQNEDGSIAFILVDGSRHKSPSAAASALMNGSAANGWRFWSLDGTLKPARSANSPAETEVKPKAKAGRPAKLIKRAKAQEGAPEGTARFWCSSCMNGFLAAAEPAPTTCPKGHGAVPTDDTAA